MQTLRALPCELTIYTIGEFHPSGSAWIAEPDEPLVIDAAAVAEVDAAGVQWLLALSEALAAQDRRLVLDSPSPPLVAACAALGLDSLTAPQGDTQGVVA